MKLVCGSYRAALCLSTLQLLLQSFVGLSEQDQLLVQQEHLLMQLLTAAQLETHRHTNICRTGLSGSSCIRTSAVFTVFEPQIDETCLPAFTVGLSSFIIQKQKNWLCLQFLCCWFKLKQSEHTQTRYRLDRSMSV